MNIPSSYTAYLIIDGVETKLIETLWSNDAIDAADKAVAGRLDARAVVVTFNFITLKDDVVYEVKSACPTCGDCPDCDAVAPGTCPFCEGEAHARACQPLRTLLMDDEINVLSLIESLDDARDTIDLLIFA